MANARESALTALSNIVVNGKYGNQAVNEQIEKNGLDAQERAFMTELTYGTLKNIQLLDFYAAPYFKGRVKAWVKLLISLTLYQILYLDNVPEHAAVSEAVNIAKKRGGKVIGGVVNGILRELCRHPLRKLEEIQDPLERLATEWSHPLWLVKLWESQYGREQTVEILKANNQKAHLTLRVNTRLVSRKELRDRLKEEGVLTRESPLSNEALIVDAGNPVRTRSFDKGCFYVQDQASMLAAHSLGPDPGSRVLDTCSAPGGKATHAAQLMQGTGIVVAHDLYPHKIQLIEENVQRLGLSNIEASVLDAATLAKSYPQESFDYIMIDAPCSALGILRRHPEAKIFKKPEDLDEIQKTSKKILEEAAGLLKPGGRMVFSTCTVNRKENEKQVKTFLGKHPDFQLDSTLPERMPEQLKKKTADGMIQLFPGEYGTDGFFIASLTKKARDFEKKGGCHE